MVWGLMDRSVEVSLHFSLVVAPPGYQTAGLFSAEKHALEKI